MKADVKYFGMIAELIDKSAELIEVEVSEKNDLRSYFELKYPGLKEMNFKIAVNKELVNNVTELEEGSEIALLPPFAGG